MGPVFDSRLTHLHLLELRLLLSFCSCNDLGCGSEVGLGLGGVLHVLVMGGEACRLLREQGLGGESNMVFYSGRLLVLRVEVKEICTRDTLFILWMFWGAGVRLVVLECVSFI
jgi:hypothetical protein